MNEDFVTLAQPASFEVTIKKSVFVARARRTESVAVAGTFVDGSSDSAANHNCWAYRIGSDYRFYDDGEPSSTAGKPILAAIQGQGLDRVTVLVIRHFGGIKLGAGGLVRAYGGAAAQCLRLARKVTVTATCRLEFQLDFADVGRVYPVLQRLPATKRSEEFTSHGVVISVEVATKALQKLKQQLLDTTAGRVRFLASDP